MTDLLGFANALNAVTARPADARVFGAVDTWGKNCSAPGANDGTQITADYLNGVLAQLRRAIRGMGVTENNADDDMLLKAIQAAAAGCVTVAQARANLPLFPHIAGASVLTVTAGSGQVQVGGGQTFVHRGVFAISTDAYDLATQRTFPTVANKTYHLRWQWNGGAPRFVLKDLADAAYNPTVAAEASSAFDTTFDDMLIARVVTNAANTATVTALSNKVFLSATFLSSVTPVFDTTPGNYAWSADHIHALNWSRTPAIQAVRSHVYISLPTGTTYVHGGANRFSNEQIGRYQVVHNVMTDYDGNPPGIGFTESRAWASYAA